MSTPATEVVDYAAEFRSLAAQIAISSTLSAAAIIAAWEVGRLSTVELVQALVGSLLRANRAALAVADLLAARELTIRRGVGTIVPGDRDVIRRVADDISPVGLDPPGGEEERLTKAVTTIVEMFDTGADPAPRIERLARAEPTNALQQGVLRAYDAHQVRGYRRGLQPTACELCVWLAKRQLDPLGYIYPTNKPMHQHPGCTCVPIPVTE